jgi:hypothetical protein
LILPYAQKYNQTLGISYQTMTRFLTTFNSDDFSQPTAVHTAKKNVKSGQKLPLRSVFARKNNRLAKIIKA